MQPALKGKNIADMLAFNFLRKLTEKGQKHFDNDNG